MGIKTAPDSIVAAIKQITANPLPVSISGSVNLSPSTLATSQASYIVITSGAGYSIGDHVTATMWWNVANITNPAFLIAAYYNWDTGLEISPNIAHLSQVQEDSLTNTQLIAATLTTKSLPLISDTPSSVASSATSVMLISANTNRRSLTIYNNSTAILYVCFGETATQAGAKVPISAGGFYEMPFPVYVGVISGIWESANGNASIYEGV